MNKSLFIPLSLILSGIFGCIRASAAQFQAEASLVEIEIAKKVYDYKIPWNVRSSQIQTNGVVIEGRQILTTAEGLSGQYICRVRKGGFSKQYNASIDWIDYYSNTALLSVEDESFWEGMEPVTLMDSIPQSGSLDVFRWGAGRIEQRAAEIIRLSVGKSRTSFIQHLQLSISSDIDKAGWAEIVVSNGKLVGLISAEEDGQLILLPSPFISAVLQHKNSDTMPALGYFDFEWMPAKNPALLNSKGLNTESVGVVVTSVGKRRLSEDTLMEGDVILEIDSFQIENDGTYLDPEYGRLSIDGLATRNHYAGDNIKMKIWRDGAEATVDYPLPKPDFEKSLIPDQRYDQAPKYLIAGGLVFQPLDGPFLDDLGQTPPILLDYYRSASRLDRSGIVLLSAVLPDDFNRGYETLRLLIVDEINSTPIHNLEDVAASLKNPSDGFHRIRFTMDSSLQHMVIDAETLDQATERILKHYRIARSSVF